MTIWSAEEIREARARLEEREQVETGEVVYIVAIRTAKPERGAEIPAAMKALNEAGLVAQPPLSGAFHAVAWYRPYEQMTANHHHALRELGLNFDDANRIVTIVSTQPNTEDH